MKKNKPVVCALLACLQGGVLGFIEERMGDVVRGGPGYSKETAWEILVEDSSGVSLEYRVLGLLFHPQNLKHFLPDGMEDLQLEFKRDRQSLMFDDDKPYDVHLMHATIGGETYEVEQYFEISKFYGKY